MRKSPAINKYLATCLWFITGNAVALDPGGQSDTDRLNQIENYNSSVTQIIFGEAYTCSGVLINNTKAQGRPLILTAAHCVEGRQDLNSITVVFGKRKLMKDGDYSGLEWRSTGATLLSSSKEIDFALLELHSRIPAFVAPIYLGWNGQMSQPDSIYSIHSPEFEETQYIFSLAKPSFETFSGLYKTVTSGHWRVDQWAQGTTSPGSSGAPLLNSNFEIIGGLSGSTDWPSYKSDYFFRFDLAYDHFSDTNNQLMTWIDPDNAGSLKRYQPVYKIKNFKFTSSVVETVKLVNEALVMEEFSVRKQSKINGVYISIGDMSDSSGATLTIVVSQNGAELYAEEAGLDGLSQYSENYIPFVTPPLVSGKISISVQLESTHPSAYITIPKTVFSELTSYFIAFNSTKP